MNKFHVLCLIAILTEISIWFECTASSNFDSLRICNDGVTLRLRKRRSKHRNGEVRRDLRGKGGAERLHPIIERMIDPSAHYEYIGTWEKRFRRSSPPPSPESNEFFGKTEDKRKYIRRAARGVPDVQKLGEEGNQIEKRNQSSFEGNYRHILRLIRKASFKDVIHSLGRSAGLKYRLARSQYRMRHHLDIDSSNSESDGRVNFL